ncbi:MAG: L,D-transpeptidase [Anaerolineae bacterium]
MKYSRRTFLKWVGASLAATSLRPMLAFLPAFDISLHRGRALTALPVYQYRGQDAPIVSHIWPDSAIEFSESRGEWYQVAGGFVQRDSIQPMNPDQNGEHRFETQYPFWAEVIGPAASVRSYCAANAPLATRIGHGGVMQVVDGLPGEPYGWYAVADAGGYILGWTQATQWQKIVMEPDSDAERLIIVEQPTHTLTAYENGKPILKAAYAAGMEIAGGLYPSERLSPGGGYWNGDPNYHGLPWRIRLSEKYEISGAYWHNRFGQGVPGPALQLPVAVARWLYEWHSSGVPVVIK